MKKKILLFSLIIMLLLCISVNADGIDWILSNDQSSIIVGDKSYEKYDGYLYPGDIFSPEATFVFDKEVYFTGLYKNNASDEILCYGYDSVNGLYVTEVGKKALDDFVEGKFSSYKLLFYNGDSYADVSAKWIKELDMTSVTEELNVRDLQHASIHYVSGYDATETVAHFIGAIYELNDSLYYINYDKLPNNYFNADGSFSYLKGTVKAFKLSGTQLDQMEQYVASMEDFQFEYENTSMEFNSDGLAKAYFIIITAIFGFILPIAPIALGVFRILTKKSKNPKRWSLVFTSCGLWLIIAISILLTLIV